MTFFVYFGFIYPKKHFLSLSTLNVTAINLTMNDTSTWYDGEVYFRYPKFLTPTQGGWLNYSVQARFIDANNPDQPDCCLYAIEPNTSDKLIFSRKNRTFSKQNIYDHDALSFMYIKDVQPITLAGREGYHFIYHDEYRIAEHYAFPSHDEQNIIQITFVTYRDGKKNLLPYKNAILDSIEFK